MLKYEGVSRRILGTQRTFVLKLRIVGCEYRARDINSGPWQSQKGRNVIVLDLSRPVTKTHASNTLVYIEIAFLYT